MIEALVRRCVQPKLGDPERYIQAFLCLHADRLENDRLRGTTDQSIGAEATPHRRFTGNTTIVPGQGARRIVITGRRKNAPFDDRFFGFPNVDPELVDRTRISLFFFDRPGSD